MTPPSGREESAPSWRAELSLLLLLLAGLGIGIRLFFLTQTSLWYDEACSLVIARSPLNRILPLALVVDANSLLFNLLLHFWLRLGGEALAWLRFLPFLFGALSLILFARFCFKELKEKALLPILLGALNYFWIYHSTELRAYSLFLLLSLLASILFLNLMRREARRYAAWFYFPVLLLGLTTHLYFIYILIAHALWNFLTEKRKGLFIQQAAALALFAPWLMLCLKRRQQYGSDITPVSPDRLLETLGSLWMGGAPLRLLAPLPIIIMGGIVLLFIVLGSRAAFKARSEIGMVSALLVCGTVLFALSAEGVLGQAALTGRYLIGISPFAYILASLGTEGLGKRTGRAAALFLAFAAVAGTAVQLALNDRMDPRFERMAENIRRNVPEETVVVHTAAYWYVPMNFYYCRERRHALLYPDDRSQQFLADPLIGGGLVVRSLKDPALAGKKLFLADPLHRFSQHTFAHAAGE